MARTLGNGLRFCSFVATSAIGLAACGGNVFVDAPSTGAGGTTGIGSTTTTGTTIVDTTSTGTTGTTSTGTVTVTGMETWTNGIPPLHTEGRWFKDPTGKTVTLRGVALADLHDVDTMRAPMNVAKVMDLVSNANQDWYARIIRLTVFPQTWQMDPETYLNTHLLPAIQHAAQLKLYVIVDWHEIADPAASDAETRKFWTRVAPLLAGYSHVLIEVFNEVQGTTTWSGFKQVAQPWVDLIRSSAPNQIILIGGPTWDQDIGGAATDPFVGDNLAYVGHVYPGIAPNVWAAGGPISTVAQTRPVMITEWGYVAGGDIPTDGTQTSFGNAFKMFVVANQLSWTAWCADTIWGPPIFDAMWQPRAGDGQMGAFTQQWLAESKGTP